MPANKPTPDPQTSAFPALSGLTGRERAEIDAILKPFSAPSNTVLFRQDAAADRMYLISSGRVELSTQLADGSELLHRTIEGGEALGESALGESPGYMATARAVTNVDGFALQVGRFNELRRAYAPSAFKVLLWISMGLCKEIRQLNTEISGPPTPSSPDDSHWVAAPGRSEAMTPECLRFLRKMPFFEAFSDDEINELSGSIRQWPVEKQHRLFSEGDPAASCFITVGGVIEVSVNRRGKPVVLAELGPGRIFGEISLLDKGPRSATCRVKKDAILHEIAADEFNRLFASGSRLSFKLLEAVHWNLLAAQRAVLAERTGMARSSDWVLI